MAHLKEALEDHENAIESYNKLIADRTLESTQEESGYKQRKEERNDQIDVINEVITYFETETEALNEYIRERAMD